MRLGGHICAALAGLALLATTWAAGGIAAAAGAMELIEPPELVAAVDGGKLPPLARP